MYRNIPFFIVGLVWFIFAASCLPVSDVRKLESLDFHPPVLMKYKVGGPRQMTFTFDKPAKVVEGSISITPDLEIESIDDNDAVITFLFAAEQIQGKEYLLEMVVEDARNNSLRIFTPFYGYNPDIPGLCINEFTTQGSGNHPDVVELYAYTGGNMAGVTIYEGTKSNWEQKLVFPSFWIEDGAYILIHFRPEGIAEEINELTDTAVSGGLDASDNAFDFWVEYGSGLSGNNGTITLYSSPQGELLDGVLYSNRSSTSDEKYRGFGRRKVMERADELAEEGGWTYAGELIAPEDAVDPEDSTATRSMCRSSESLDTDSAGDWHIVPTSTFSFGTVNSDEVYVP